MAVIFQRRNEYRIRRERARVGNAAANVSRIKQQMVKQTNKRTNKQLMFIMHRTYRAWMDDENKIHHIHKHGELGLSVRRKERKTERSNVFFFLLFSV